MIQEKFPMVGVWPLYNMREDSQWVEQIDIQLRDISRLKPSPITPSRLIVFGTSNFLKTYRFHNGQFQSQIDAGMNHEHPIYKSMLDNVRHTEDWRAGVIYNAFNRYPHVVSTVDAAILNGSMVLLGKKKNESKWRFPGGYTEPNSESDERDLSREVKEETNLIVAPDAWMYLCRTNIADWRYRMSGDTIRTGFFMTREFSGVPKGGDDLPNVDWFDLFDPNIEIMSEHQKLWDRLKKAFVS